MKKVEKNHKSIKEQSNETYKNQGSKITKTQNNKKINNSLYMKPHGVTLVSLVVTIIVLIILAGISLNLTIGENGLFTMAKKAKENTELAQIEEQTRMNELYTQIEQEGYYDTPAIGEIEGTIDELSKTIEDLKSQLENEQQQRQQLQEQIQNLNEEISNLQNEVNTGNSKIEEKQKQIDELKEQIAQSETDIEDKQQQLDSLQNEVNTLKQQVAANDSAIKGKDAQINSLNEQLTSVSEKLTNDESKIKELETAKSSLETEVSNLKQEITTMSSNYVTKNDLSSAISQLSSQIKLEAYPVGSIYISTDATNPASKFGGTWESYGEGKTLLSSSGTSGQTGGSNKVTLTTANLPSHTHIYQKANSTTEAHVLTLAEIPKMIPRFHDADVSQGNSVWAYGYWNLYSFPGEGVISTITSKDYCTEGTGSDQGHTHSISTTTTDTSAVGNGTEFSVQNEFITVHVWKRTA